MSPECLNTFFGISLRTRVLNKKDSSKWNATRDKSLAAMFIFFVRLLILARSHSSA